MELLRRQRDSEWEILWLRRTVLVLGLGVMALALAVIGLWSRVPESPNRDPRDEKQGIILDALAFFRSDIDPPAEADLVILGLGVRAFGHELPGTGIERVFLIDFIILSICPDFDAEGFARHLFTHDDSALKTWLLPAAEEVDGASGAHHDVEGP